ncbi:MAG: helicase-related protein [Planctomycetaceae bacterium]
MNPGSIVRCRNRDWVLLPSDDADLLVLRPLTGSTDEVVAIHSRLASLIGYSLPEEPLRPSQFKAPTVDDLSDASSAHLLWHAARLTLREGATPFRSLGRISIRPRIYQFVPLLMGLRMDTVRMLIADDVGVGKTIEALLVARELLDRGEIRRMCVLCPPYLCEQWQKELAEKFNLDAVVIRSGTVSQLERRKTSSDSIYKHYPVQVASIDFLKSDRNRHLFLLDCPDLVIVDEAHGSAVSAEGNQSQHQRHQLIRAIADKPNQHLILLTATPHSGVESAFRSLLTLLQPEFADWDTSSLSEPQRIHLARHFVQRTRRDIEHDWEGEHCFPKRIPDDKTYRLSGPYRELFNQTFEFCSEIVRTGKSLNRRQQRVRCWGALALLRCVMSSPAAAVAALESRHDSLATSDEDPEFRSFVFESAEDRTDDDQPTPPVEAAEATFAEGDRKRLRELGKMAKALLDSPQDTKLGECAKLVASLLNEGFHPIVWCRYIATADSLAEGLQSRLRKEFPKLRVVAVTGRLGDEERRAKIDELAIEPVRVLVATDCVSEGMNLQHAFNAVIHYDLPWNPNRLEQREGRVDRYGQRSETVKAIRYFSPDSAVDGVVLDVLLNKAREIHRTLGTHVPVPAESETVTEALLNALFIRGEPAKAQGNKQRLFDFVDDEDSVDQFHQRWQLDAEREKVNRSRFAQRALKPAEVRQELETTDAVLGDPDAVQEFVLTAAQRLGLNIRKEKQPDVFRVLIDVASVSTLPPAVTFALPSSKSGQWLISFVSPTPEGADYLGRNHPFVASLARFLMESALTKGSIAVASRCGVIRTKAVTRLTSIALLRVRYLVNQPDRPSLLSEEVLVTGIVPGTKRSSVEWLSDQDALRLLADAKPDANVPMAEKRELIQVALESWPALEGDLHKRIDARASELEKSHKRVRQAVAMKVRQLTVAPQLPPDLLGMLVLQPVVG